MVELKLFLTFFDFKFIYFFSVIIVVIFCQTKSTVLLLKKRVLRYKLQIIQGELMPIRKTVNMRVKTEFFVFTYGSERNKFRRKEEKMKKKYIGAILLSLCVAISIMFGTTAFAAGKSFDGTTNLATDASKWTESSWTVANNYATIDENGITFTEYGTASAVAAVSLKEGLPYSGKITINFCSQIPDSGDPVGFMKVIFADGSGAANGNAMKPWEISDRAEHLALEINFSGISLWRYNIGNTFNDDGSSGEQIQLSASSNNYIDGNEHKLVIEYAANKTDYALKLSVDGVDQYDGTIDTEKFYCNNILTIGGYANSTVTDDLAIKEVLIEQNGDDPDKEIDKNNLLGQETAWTMAEDSGVEYDASSATLKISGYDGKDAAVLNKTLPSEAKITLKLAFDNLPATQEHVSMAVITLLSNDTQDVYLQIDDDGNIWLYHKDYSQSEEGEEVAHAGDWAPGLLSGTNTLTISITPELTNGDEDIYISVAGGGKTIGLAVGKLALMNGNQLALSCGKVGSIVFSDVRVEDLVQEKPDTAIVEKNLLENSTDWSCVSSVIDSDSISWGGSDYLQYNRPLPIDSTVQFTVQAGADSNAWYYFGIGNFQSSLWDSEEYQEGQARFRITTTGSQGHFAVDLNGTPIATKSANTATIFDGTKQVFAFVTESTADGLKVTLLRNGNEEFSATYAADTPFGASQSLYMMFRATADHTAAPVLTDIKCSYQEDIDVEAYNEAIATKRAIYALNAEPSFENAEAIKAEAEALLAKLETYTDEQLAVVTNRLYAEFVIERAESVLTDKAAADAVISKIEALNFATITADNVKEAKAALAEIKELYNKLTDAQKELVHNYAEVEALEQAIKGYESSNPGENAGENPDKEKTGCGGIAGYASLGAVAAAVSGAALLAAGVIVFQKRKKY